MIGLFAALLLGVACGGGDGKPGTVSQPTATAQPATSSAIDPADFQATVDNPLFPLRAGDATVFEGEEQDPDTGEVIAIRVESTVLSQTETVAGVEVTVVEVKDYENGELTETTLDYYAQRNDGAVYYFGERVDKYKNGELVSHEGQWLAGEGENLPGIFMPANPRLSDAFDQERAPGVAEDRSEVIDIGETVTTPAGTFTGCIKTEDYDPIGDVTEFKFYCRDVGLVREESADGQTFLDLVSF